MKASLLSVMLGFLLLGCQQESTSIDLFNGTDLTGWHVDVPEMDSVTTARNPFIVRDGKLVSLGTPEGHLITDAVYSNYRLEVTYRFVE